MRVAIARHICIAALAAVGLAVGAWGAEPKPSPQLTELADPAAAALPVVNLAPGPEYSDQTRMFQGIPGIELAASGRLWVTWYGGGRGEDRGNYVLLATSEDGGSTWSDVRLVVDPDGDGPIRAYDPCLWHDPQGRLWLFWAQGYGSWGDTAGVWAITTRQSDADNPLWSEPVRFCDGIMGNKPTVLSSGEWLFPVYNMARWQHEGSAGVYSSSDQGATWSLLGKATVPAKEDRNADEHMIVERNDGTLWMLVRTNYGIGESTSADRGRTWSPVTPSEIQHPTARFFVRRLQSGNLLLVKHGPIGTRTGRSHLTAFLSRDDGQTWLGGLLLDERHHVSYPDGVQAPDGTIYIVYDYDRGGRGKEILVAKFAEDDVARGACVSDAAELGLLVNKARGVGWEP